MFFGCIGPKHNTLSSRTVPYTATSVTLESQVTPLAPFLLPNGAAVTPSE